MLLQQRGLCKGVKHGYFQLLWGHQTVAAVADVLGRVEPLVLIPPLCLVWSLLSCFLASEEPTGWGIRAGAGQSTSVTLGTIQAAPRQPFGPDNLSPDAKVL